MTGKSRHSRDQRLTAYLSVVDLQASFIYGGAFLNFGVVPLQSYTHWPTLQSMW